MPPSRKRTWEACLKSVVVGLSDRQLVTGLSISIKAIDMYTKGTIDTYHLGIAGDLALLSNTVHATSLLLSNTERHKKHAQSGQDGTSTKWSSRGGGSIHIALTVWRRTCMLATFTLLLALRCLPLKSLDVFSCLSQCATTTNHSGFIEVGVFVFILILLHVPVLSSFGNTSAKAGCWILNRLPLNGLSKILRTTNAFFKFTVPILATFFRMMRGLSVSLVYATFMIVSPILVTTTIRINFTFAQQVMSDDDRRLESELGFGQMVPLLLLMLPFMSAIEAYYGDFPYTLGANTSN